MSNIFEPYFKQFFNFFQGLYSSYREFILGWLVNVENLIALAIYTSSSSFSAGIIFMAAQIKVGEKAPDFTLPDVDLKQTSLKDFLGQKIVITFFIGAFTETCTKEVCEFRDAMFRLVDLKAQVIGIDLTAPFSSKRFSGKNRLPFPVLSDPTHKVFEKYGLHFSRCDEKNCCFGTGCYPLVKRCILVLDKEGIVRYVWTSSKTTTEPNYVEIQKTLESIP